MAIRRLLLLHAQMVKVACCLVLVSAQLTEHMVAMVACAEGGTPAAKLVLQQRGSAAAALFWCSSLMRWCLQQGDWCLSLMRRALQQRVRGTLASERMVAFPQADSDGIQLPSLAQLLARESCCA